MLTPLSDLDPTWVGPFRLRGRIGDGGTGMVYLGLDDGGQAAAVKVLPARLAEHPDHRRRFRAEAEAARQVGSVRRVARFLGDSQDDDPPWTAFEYVPGVTLADAVRPDPDSPGHPLPLALLPGLALGLAQALAQTHERGVVHRDLKPSNIALSLTGPTVIDFGMALVGDESANRDLVAVEPVGEALPEAAAAAVAHGRSGESGSRIGTPYWMAPEQHVGAELGPHTDMFSWGTCVAYAIFGSWRSREDALAALAAQESDGGQDLMSEILRNVVAATDRDPARRPTAAEVAARLAAAARGPVRADPSAVWTLPLDLRGIAGPESAGASVGGRPDGDDPGRSGSSSGSGSGSSSGGGGAAAPAGGVPPQPAAGPHGPAAAVGRGPGLADSGRAVPPVRPVPVAALAVVAFGVLAAGVGLAAAGTRIGEIVGPVAAGNIIALLGLLLVPNRFVASTTTALWAGLAGAGIGLAVARLTGIDEPLRVVLELAVATVAVAVAAFAVIGRRRRPAGRRRRRRTNTPLSSHHATRDNGRA